MINFKLLESAYKKGYTLVKISYKLMTKFR